jgi:aminoglycoside/choline kinase family phosphotransferase
MHWSIERIVLELFYNLHGNVPVRIQELPRSGSSRQYFRLSTENNSYIAAFNTDVRENKAFLAMTRHFYQLGLPVPEILAVDDDEHTYLISDLGDTTLFSLLPHGHPDKQFDENIIRLYKKTIGWLPAFQVKGAEKLDFRICYPRMAFDRHSMMWDLNYFKYYFLKTSGIAFDEQKLEDSFEIFTSRLLAAPRKYFMYRDFQSRNVMVVNDQPFFIDYQGGRNGALQYDIASILFDAKANIPFELRQVLLEHYINEVSKVTSFDERQFLSLYYDFVLIRVMQALATYGFRGGVEKKPLFLQSMPFALNNLKWIAENGLLPTDDPYLCDLIERVAATAPGIVYKPAKKGLTVTIKSFSYRQGIPPDYSGHGGGFVFDCRMLPNPGRQNNYKMLTGKDDKVAAFLESNEEVSKFVEITSEMIRNAVKEYISKGNENLMVSFGCTGGQHRSVYCAEKLAKTISNAYPVNVELEHMEAKNWPEGC